MQIGYSPPDSDSSLSGPSRPIAEASASPPSRRFSGDSLDDELEVHFIAVTSKTLGMIQPPPERDPWQHDVPIRMQSSRFLWHGVLSITALHLSSLRPDFRDLYYQRACQHQDQALPLFRTEVKNVGVNNVLEVVAFCVIISTFNFYAAKSAGSQSSPGSLQPLVPRVEIFEPLIALRSGAILVRECLPVVQEHGGALSNIIGALWAVPPPPQDDLAQQDAIASLDELGTALQTSGLHANANVQAVALLRQCFIRFSVRPKGWLHIIFWPTSVSEEYVDALRAGDQGAVAVFLYWCASMNSAPKMWWLDGWASAAGQTYLDRLDPHWDSLLAWPRSQLDVTLNFPYMTAEETQLLYADTAFPTTQAQDFLSSATGVMVTTAPWDDSILGPAVTQP